MGRKYMLEDMNRYPVTWSHVRRHFWHGGGGMGRYGEYFWGVRAFAYIIRGVRRWVQRSVAHIRYRPGSEGYERARADWQIRLGKRRATRRYKPY